MNSENDPIRNFKFEITDNSGHKYGFMRVTGLCDTRYSLYNVNHILSLYRGITENHDLHDWHSSRERRDLTISVDGGKIVFEVRGALPKELIYSDLDAEANHLFLEGLALECDEIIAKR